MPKKTYRLFFFFALILSQQSFAQFTISGSVVDDQEAAIAFANVILQNVISNKVEDGTITDEEGKFDLAISQKGNYKLTISYLGYADFEQSINLEQSIDLGILKLNAAPNMLGEIVVSAERRMMEQREDKLIFNVGTSPLKTGYDGMEVLQRSPGIWIDEQGGILMRNQQATILVNGRRLQLSGSNLANYLQNLRSENVQAIEIQTSISANADGESSGGIVNIILKKKPTGFRSNLKAFRSFRGDGFGTNSGGLNWSYGAQEWNIYGNYKLDHRTKDASIRSEVFYDTSLDYLNTDRIAGDTLVRQNYQLGFTLEPHKNHLFGAEVFGTGSKLDFYNNSLVTLSNDGDLLAKGTTTFGGDTDNNVLSATANYSWTIDTLKSQLNVFADFTKQAILKNSLAKSVYESGLFSDTLERNGSEAITDIYALQSDWIKNFSNGLKLESGAKWTHTERENSLLSEFLSDDVWTTNNRTTDFDYQEEVLAAYFSLGKQLDEKHYLKAGLRLENTDLTRIDLLKDTMNGQNYTFWLPSFFASRKLSDKTSLTFSYSKRIRRPSFNLLNNDVRKINDFRYEIGNPDLAPEQVHKLDLSLNQKKQSFSVFYRQNNDAINGVFTLDNGIVYYQRINAGAQKQVGLSYNRFGNLKPWWYIKATGALYNRRFTDESGVDMFKQNTVYLRINNNFKINSTTNFDLSGYYVSPRADAFYLAAARYNINLMLQKTFFQKKLICRVYFDDPFNRLVYANERVFETFKTTNSRKPRTRVLRLWLSYNFATKNKVNTRKNKSKNEARGRLE